VHTQVRESFRQVSREIRSRFHRVAIHQLTRCRNSFLNLTEQIQRLRRSLVIVLIDATSIGQIARPSHREVHSTPQGRQQWNARLERGSFDRVLSRVVVLFGIFPCQAHASMMKRRPIAGMPLARRTASEASRLRRVQRARGDGRRRTATTEERRV